MSGKWKLNGNLLRAHPISSPGCARSFPKPGLIWMAMKGLTALRWPCSPFSLRVCRFTGGCAKAGASGPVSSNIGAASRRCRPRRSRSTLFPACPRANAAVSSTPAARRGMCPAGIIMARRRFRCMKRPCSRGMDGISPAREARRAFFSPRPRSWLPIRHWSTCLKRSAPN